MEPFWEHFSHQADIGIRGAGKNLEEAFQQGALALTAVITDLDLIAQSRTITLSCESPEVDILFLDWINAIIYEMATRKMLFRQFSVHTQGDRLTAELEGELINVAKHQPSVEIKGATFTQLAVLQHPNGWRVVQCVVDV